jgi:formamidopyrimidine-DNA glycosylase
VQTKGPAFCERGGGNKQGVPELPDVEGLKRYFARHASGRRVERVDVRAPDIVRNTSPSGLARAVRGRRLAKPRRHGKWMIVPLDGSDEERGPALLFHFGMTGGLRWTGSRRDQPHPHDRVVLHLRDGQLRYRNMRKFGGIWLARSGQPLEQVTGPLGPDAQSLSREDLDRVLAGRRGGLKATVMNQGILAGIGNELSDEILWQARLNPRRRVSTLRRRDLDRLHLTMQRVISVSNRHGLIPRKRGWISSQRGVRDPRCPRCGRSLRRETVAGRTAYWCPRCQRG